MNENTISSNLTRIKDATDDIRSTLGTPGAAIEDVASDVATLSIEYNQMASDYNDLIIENNQLRRQIQDLTPTGTYEITENGTYNIAQYASVVINVQSGPGPEPEPGTFVITVYDENDNIINDDSLEIYNDYEDTTVHTNPYTITDIEPNLEFSIIVNYPDYYTRRVICNSNDSSCNIPLVPISNPEAGKIRVYTRIINPDAESDENLYNLTDISFGNIHPQGATKDNLGYKYIMDVQSGLSGRFSFLDMEQDKGFRINVSKPNETSWDYGHTSDYLWKGFTNETKNDVIYIQRTDGEASLDIINDLQIEDENYLEFTGITQYKPLGDPLNYPHGHGTQRVYFLTFDYENDYTGMYKYIVPRLDGEIMTDRVYLYGFSNGDIDRHILELYCDESKQDDITYDIQSGTNVSADILINASEYNLDLGSDSAIYAEYNLCGAIVNDQLIFDNLRISNWEEGSKFNNIQLTLQYTDGEQLTLVNQDLWPGEDLPLAWDNQSGVQKTYTIDSTKEIETITLTTSEPITYEYDEDNHRDMYWSREIADCFNNDIDVAHNNGDLTVEVDGQHEWDSTLNEQYYGTYRIAWNEWGGWELDSPKAILTVAEISREDGSFGVSVFTITYLDEVKVIDLRVINETTGDLVDHNTVELLYLDEYNAESLIYEWQEYWRNGMLKELSEETISVHAICQLADPVNWEFVSSDTYDLPIEDQYTLIEFIVREKGGNE